MHSKLLYIFVSVLFVYYVQSARLTNNTERRDQLLVRNSRDIGPYFGLINCAMKYDVSCFIDAAEDYLEVKRNELLAQADVEVLKATGRSDSDSKPSHLADSLSRLLSELTGMFQKGISGIFEVGKDLNDDDAVENGSDLINATGEDTNGEARAKKKRNKRKLRSMLKLFAIGFVIFKKISIVLKLIHIFFNLKFSILALGGLLLHAIKLWHSIKKDGAHPTKVIYYEHAQHQHHYGHGEDEGHAVWGSRALEGSNNITGTDEVAYSAHRPYYLLEFN